MRDNYQSKLGKLYLIKNAVSAERIQSEVDRILMNIEFLIQTGEKLPYKIEVTKALKEGCKILEITNGLEKSGVVIAPMPLLKSYDEVFIKVIDFL